MLKNYSKEHILNGKMRRCEEILRNKLTREDTSPIRNLIWNFTMDNEARSMFFNIAHLI